MIAPEPILRPRGTPLSVYHRIRALTELGHSVDLVTYPFGDAFELPGLKVHRAARPPGIRDVGIGPTIAKGFLDVPLFFLAWRLARTGRFDLLHTHEEAGVMGAFLSRRLGIPHVYDMHSSLPEQFANFARFNWRPVVSVFKAVERYILNRSDGVIAICEELRRTVLNQGCEGVVAMIENTLQFDSGEAHTPSASDLRRTLGIDDAPAIVYTGTLEPYQGMDLFVDAAPAILDAVPAARFVVVGGTTAQVNDLRKHARRIGVESSFCLVGTVNPWEVRHYHEMADTLVTCRTRGTNTPLKLYHYLQAGRPIVATAIRSHTQVLDAATAELVEPEPTSIARGVVRVLGDPDRASALSDASRRAAADRYDEASGIESLARFMDELNRRRPGGVLRSGPPMTAHRRPAQPRRRTYTASRMRVVEGTVLRAAADGAR